MTGLLRVSHTMTLAWQYGASRYFAELMRAVRDERRLLGLRCPRCRRVYLPPRPVCGNCHAELREWVEVKDTGTVRAFTVVHVPIIDPATGQPRPMPYGMALIQLDGADTTLNHYLAENEAGKLRIGMRVRAVWREERTGTLGDIVHFEEVRGEQ
ncbi:MAG: Zn-ribbon domain-containing OB-fold protein [Anaerolineales bacterium]|nr:Zn-ribbon domain-containing OB-fold protein [Anaerolineales bacterium]